LLTNQVKSSQVAFNKIMANALSYKRNTKYNVKIPYLRLLAACHHAVIPASSTEDFLNDLHWLYSE